MTKPPEKSEPDPTADQKFQQVVQHFLKTPHKKHEPINKKATKEKGGSPKTAAPPKSSQ